MKTIGQEIYEYRKRNEMSQQAFAELIGVSRAYLTEIENGNRIPGTKTEMAIAKVIAEEFIKKSDFL